MVDVRLLHLPEELPRVRRERFDIPALAFGEDRVEGKRRFAGAGQPGEDHQLVAGDLDVDILEVVFPSAADNDPVVLGHRDWGPSLLSACAGMMLRTLVRSLPRPDTCIAT